MIPIYVPDLKRKLDLVARHGGYKSLGEIAAEMGVKEPTLRSWTVHRTERVEGTVSKKGREPVIRFFCAHLPHLSEQAVIDLLEGPYDDMAAAFIVTSFTGLANFIEREASFEGAKLIVDLDDASAEAERARLLKQRKKDRDELASKLMVTIKIGPTLTPKDYVPLGTDFRLEFPIARRAKFFLGLQKSPQGWAVIPAAPAAGGKIVHMPAAEEPGKAAMMSEDHDKGASRFTLIQSMQSFPDFIHVNLQDGVPLNRTDIGFLTRHLRNIPKADRTLHAIDIWFHKA